jgi:hypothetical protein
MWQSRHKWVTLEKVLRPARAYEVKVFDILQTLVDTGRYQPHQGEREKQRRMRQAWHPAT